MPTGYTCIIEEKPDLTLREFALRCARAFGACVAQRDEPIGVLPRVDPPSDYHDKELKKARARLVELRSMTLDGAQALWLAEVAQYAKLTQECAAKCADLERRYKAMRAKVEAWMPPTPEHEGLRRFNHGAGLAWWLCSYWG